MKILLVAATEGEVPAAVANLATNVDVLVTGVGMVATAAHCARALTAAPYDLALNVGVCGAFGSRYAPGRVVHVVSDCLSELGAQDGGGFLTIHQLGLLGKDDPPFRDGLLVNPRPPAIAALAALPAVRGITVNTVHGREPDIADVSARCNPDVETMEGAAFMYACLLHGIPFAQVRAVSNIVERRNRAAWKLAEAIEALARTTTDILQQA